MLVSTRWSWNQSSMEFHLAQFRSLPAPHLCDCLVYEDTVWPEYALWLTASLSKGEMLLVLLLCCSCSFCRGVQHPTPLPLGLVVGFGFLILAVSEQVQCRPGLTPRVGAQGY